MRCPHCDSEDYGRDKHATPTDRDGVTFRAHNCFACRRTFLSAQLVIADELEPVARLDAVLKAVMDEADARAQDEIENAESAEALAEGEE